MRRAPGVSGQGYCRWRRRPASGHALRDAELAGETRRVWEVSRRIYGSPKVFMRLSREGVATSERRVGRADGAPDPVRRRFDADGPDQAWFADIAYVRTHQGWPYLAVVMDIWSRRIVG